MNDVAIEKSVVVEPVTAEEIFSPGPEWAAEPFSDRDCEAGLGAIEQASRRFTIQEFAQDMLSLAIANLHRQRDPCRKLRNAVIEERNAGLQAYRHRRPVNLAEDVVGQIDRKSVV